MSPFYSTPHTHSINTDPITSYLRNIPIILHHCNAALTVQQPCVLSLVLAEYICHDHIQKHTTVAASRNATMNVTHHALHQHDNTALHHIISTAALYFLLFLFPVKCRSVVILSSTSQCCCCVVQWLASDCNLSRIM